MSALDLITEQVKGWKGRDLEDLPPHPGVSRGWELARDLAARLSLPSPGALKASELADDRLGRSWARFLAVRAGRVLHQACTGNRTTLRDALVDLAVLASCWALAVERRGL